MPEYLSPGVYVEETSFRSKSIEGVSTTTTGFVGPCRYGPVDLPSDVITSLVEFERAYGGGDDLGLRTLISGAAGGRRNYLWQAARAFFAEGGKRLYVARAFYRFDNGDVTGDESAAAYYRGPDDDLAAGLASGLYPDGHARSITSTTVGTDMRRFVLRARYPGAYGNFRVRVRAVLGQNLLVGTSEAPIQGALFEGDIVTLIAKVPSLSPPSLVGRHRASFNPSTGLWSFTDSEGVVRAATVAVLLAEYEMRVVTLTVSAAPVADPTREEVWAGLAPDAARAPNGQPDGLTRRLGYDAVNPSPNRELPIVARALTTTSGGVTTELTDGLLVLSTLATAALTSFLDLGKVGVSGSSDVREFILAGGHDGRAPEGAQYDGAVSPTTDRKTGLKLFEDIEDISIVAAPGATADVTDNAALDLCQRLIAHCQRMRYRIAVLDPRNGSSVADVRAFRARMDSSHAALYYPWVRVIDPISRQPIHLPPSGFVAGIYSRNDGERGVHKAPANEVVNLAVGFETALGKGQQDVLNPEGINCFRFFEGRGHRLWGARTTSSDPEWKYVNLRRYFAYLERSVERGTQWAVFEPNAPQLWGNVRRTIESFLFNEFQSGALLGDRPDAAYFVKCDRSTMTQNDLDNGRLVCLVGVAAVRPAEFVIFRVGQWTGDRKAG